MESKGKIMAITSDMALAEELKGALASRGYELLPVATARHAAVNLGAHEFAAVIADHSRFTPADRQALQAIHKGERSFPLFLLDTLATLSPVEAMPLRRLSWPFPQGFADQIRSCDNPIVFLADQALFASRALQNGLQEAGVQFVALESVVGLTELLVKQAAAYSKISQTKTFWQKLGGTNQGEEEYIGKILVAHFPGSLAEAEAFDGRLRQSLPQAACYYVTSLDPVRMAIKCVRENFPASLMREQAARVAAILAEGFEAQAGPKEKERILLLDNYKPTLESLTQALTGVGYEVTPSMDGEQALKLARGSRFHLAVIGTAMAYAQHSGIELAQKLREEDPDLRIIFMVERYPLQTALQGVSQVVELGLDDALLKPVEASRLIFSVGRALERRSLILENARLLKEIQESNRQLAQINGFQKKFFAMVAHDVKNPLTAILGYSEVLGMRLKDQPSELKCASHIHSAARILNFLVSDLVDLAAIESGKLRVNIGPLDLAAVINDLKSRIEVVAQQRKIQFQVMMPQFLPPLAGDPVRIGQVIQNLCTNGIQYTKESGRVTVKVDASPAWVAVSVIDTGIGISKADQARVFERFFQSQEAQQMRKAGFGLGLKIAREIIQMHGGQIGLESEPGRGSRFFFTLPVQKGSATPPPVRD